MSTEASHTCTQLWDYQLSIKFVANIINIAHTCKALEFDAVATFSEKTRLMVSMYMYKIKRQ